jgi:hypothetical protein
MQFAVGLLVQRPLKPICTDRGCADCTMQMNDTSAASLRARKIASRQMLRLTPSLQRMGDGWTRRAKKSMKKARQNLVGVLSRSTALTDREA